MTNIIKLLFSKFNRKLELEKQKKLILSSGLFDREFYLSHNPDLSPIKIDPLGHFINFGGFEGRDPGPLFSISGYQKENSKVTSSKLNPLVHYIKYGKYDNPKSKMDSFNKLIEDHSDQDLNFVFPNPEIIKQFETELINWNGAQLRIVERKKKYWVIKNNLDQENIQREVLVSSLARGLVNASEVKTLSHADVNVLMNMGLLPQNATPYSTILVRSAQDYSIDELPQKKLDGALAGEYVFSLWVRRHDPHYFNRAFTKAGIPVFFDYQASLDCDGWLYNVDDFFANTNPGFAGRWRIRERTDETLNTLSLRKMNHVVDFDLIESKDRFIASVKNITKQILTHNYDFKKMVAKAGYFGEEMELAANFLTQARKTLPEDVKKMLALVFS